jgi:tetratricopeptide (TPR) repeat protein
VEIIVNKGQALCSLKKYDEAIKCFDKALKLEPDCKDAKEGKEKALKGEQ